MAEVKENVIRFIYTVLWTVYNQVLNSADLRMRAICFVLCRFESCSSFRFEDI